MAVRIRMRRMGRRNRPYFRIVAADARSPRDGRFLEKLGTYDPLKETDNFVIDKERVLYWIGVGAQVSEAVAPFLLKQGIDPRKKACRAGAAAGKAKGASTPRTPETAG